MTEEFAEGLELDPKAPLNQEPAFDDSMVMARLGEIFEGLPEGETLDGFTDEIVKWQKSAAEAEELRRRVEEQEAAIAAYMAQKPEPKKTEPEPTPTPAPRKKKYEPVAFDDSLKMFIGGDFSEFDQSSGMWKPKRLLPQVLQACEQKNKQLYRQQQIADDLTADPEAFVREIYGEDPRVAELQKKIDDLQKSLMEQIEPLRKDSAATAAERFNWENRDVLFVSNGGNYTPTPTGDVYGKLVANGMEPEKALALAKEIAPVQQAAPAPKKTKQPAFSDPIRKRMNGENLNGMHGSGNGYRAPSGPKFLKSFADVLADAKAIEE